MNRPWWLAEADGTAYGLDALPYGMFRVGNAQPRAGVRIGHRVLDLAAVTAALHPELSSLFTAASLNRFMAAGPAVWADVRKRLTAWLASATYGQQVEQHLRHVDEVTMMLPFEPADYVDFYSSRHHAENLGALFRPGQPPLTANWLHLPIGYHGRAGSLVVSGTEVRRPSGQIRVQDSEAPVISPSRKLDIEAEVGFVVGMPSTLGESVPAADVANHVFGVVLVNDWSARDLQSWEYVPLGPFLGKSFATSVSAWVLPLAALEHARVAPPVRTVPLLSYLEDGDDWGLDIDLAVSLNGAVVSRPPFGQMYWTIAQQVAHLTVNGAALRTGDLLASGTVSGPGEGQRGSLIELSWNGDRPLATPLGERRFLEDGDEVVITATVPGPGGASLALGEVRGRVVPARGS